MGSILLKRRGEGRSNNGTITKILTSAAIHMVIGIDFLLFEIATWPRANLLVFFVWRGTYTDACGDLEPKRRKGGARFDEISSYVLIDFSIIDHAEFKLDALLEIRRTCSKLIKR